MRRTVSETKNVQLQYTSACGGRTSTDRLSKFARNTRRTSSNNESDWYRVPVSVYVFARIRSKARYIICSLSGVRTVQVESQQFNRILSYSKREKDRGYHSQLLSHSQFPSIIPRKLTYVHLLFAICRLSMTHVTHVDDAN